MMSIGADEVMAEFSQERSPLAKERIRPLASDPAEMSRTDADHRMPWAESDMSLRGQREVLMTATAKRPRGGYGTALSECFDSRKFKRLVPKIESAGKMTGAEVDRSCAGA